MNIYWSNKAKQDYWNNVDYLLEVWTEKEAKNFIAKVEVYVDLIARNPKAFSASSYKNIRCVPIVPQITLFYRVSKDTIQLVRFWNNKQNPKKINL